MQIKEMFFWLESFVRRFITCMVSFTGKCFVK